MNDIYFADVFYSIENDFGFELNGDEHATALPCAICVPHAKASLIRRELACGFSAVKNLKPKTVAVLCPLHAPLLKKDAAYSAATTQRTQIASLRISAAELPGTVKNDAYFKEEPAAEELFPMIKRLFPEAEILPVFAPQNADTAALGKIVLAIKNAEQDTLFIVSSNRTQEKHCAQMWLEAVSRDWERISGEPLREVLFAGEIGNQSADCLQVVRTYPVN